MLKKTFATGSLLLAAAGVTVTSLPMSAQAVTTGVGCCGGFSHRFFSLNRSFNENEAVNFNRIRIRIRNTNNNIAVATNREN